MAALSKKTNEHQLVKHKQTLLCGILQQSRKFTVKSLYLDFMNGHMPLLVKKYLEN
jgi:hypothetical protein